MLDHARLVSLLRQLSYLAEGVEASQNEVRAAVRVFQGDTGLIADGIFGLKSSAALERLADRFLDGNIARRYARFRCTRYYIESETDYSGDKTIPLFDTHQRILGLTTPAFFAHVSLEGTGRLADGRLINVAEPSRLPVPATDYAAVLAYARAMFPAHPEIAGISISRSDGTVTAAQPFDLVTDVGIGYGMSAGRANVPFKTLAADVGVYDGCDPRFKGKGGLVPRGTRVYIPEVAGQALPDRTTHDGWFTVIDTGALITGAHFDVFCGTRKWAAIAWAIRERMHGWFQILDGEGNVIDTVERRLPLGYITGLTD